MSLLQFTENKLNVKRTPQFYTKCEADNLLKELLESSFYDTKLKIDGKDCTPLESTPIVFGDGGISYTFQGTTLQSKPWNPLLEKLQDDVQKATCCEFNLAHVNLPYNDSSKIENHDFSLEPSSPICVLSFGGKRTLVVKEALLEINSIDLEHGCMCKLYPPSDELFTYSITSEPNETDPHINLIFFKVCFHEPSPKKSKMDDWMDHLYHTLYTSLNNTWHLERLVYVSLHNEKSDLQIHIRQFIQNAQLDYVPTCQGVIMQPSTWVELSGKLIDFNLRFNDSSFICNNQLSVFNDNGKGVLQQIYKTRDSFTLNPIYLKLSSDQILKLCEIRSEISEGILKTLFTITLPHIILRLKPQKCHHERHCEYDEGKQQLMDMIHHEIIKTVNLAFKCIGCIENRLSQSNHPCLSTTDAEKYLAVSEKAWFMLNIPFIAREICEKKCTCLYDGDFFANIFLEDYREYVQNVLFNSFFQSFPYDV